MKSWSDIGFEIEITRDHSPTLRLLKSLDPLKAHGESMHHSGGACAETLLIYATPIRQVLEKIPSGSGFVIVGLGLGYIELCVARESILLGLKPSDVSHIVSFESLPELREFFWNWIHGNEANLLPEVFQVYEDLASFLIAGTDLKVHQLKDFLKVHFQNLTDIKGALKEDFEPLPKSQGILYDAFSFKTTPHLWDENFLKKFVEETAAETCFFSTYACRVSLRKALEACGFDVKDRPGFFSKRNSTIAWKEPSDTEAF